MSDHCHNCSNFTDDGDILKVCKECFNRLCEERDEAVRNLEHFDGSLDKALALVEELERM